MAVYFSNSDVDYVLKDADLMKKWIFRIVTSYGKNLGRVNYLFCSDEYVYDANVKFLGHDTYTDIITFDYVEGNLI